MAEVNTDSARHNAQTKAVQESIYADLVALKTAVDAMATKLNADAGVTDTDYATAAALTTSIPS